MTQENVRELASEGRTEPKEFPTIWKKHVQICVRGGGDGDMVVAVYVCTYGGRYNQRVSK
jgi:hypothetical protein